MENEVIINVDNCYICNEYMGCFVCELSTLTTYSKKPISNLIGKKKANSNRLLVF